MASKKIPKRDFKIKYAGKTLNILVASHSTRLGEMWGVQCLCIWGCNAKFIITNKSSPRDVYDELKIAIRKHCLVVH